MRALPLDLRSIRLAIAAASLLCCAAAAHGASLVGKPAPPLAGVDLQHQPVDLSALRGQRVLVMFWATWCSPCRKEMPLVQAVFDKYHAQGFAVIAVDVGDDSNDAAAFLHQYRLAFPVLLDPNGHTAERFQVIGLPTNYLIDADGVVRAEILGGDLTTERLEKSLAALTTAR